MKKSKVKAIIIFYLVCISTLSISAQPEEIRVKEELKILLEELGIERVDPDAGQNALVEFINNVIESFSSFVSFLLNKSSFLVFPLVLILIFFIGYLGLKFFSHFRKESNILFSNKTQDKTVIEELSNNSYSYYVLHAEEQAKKGEYGEALVLLHKASIVYLRQKKILLAEKYHTNNEIRRDLKIHEEYYEHFSSLAGIAERKTFRSEMISEDIYNEYFILFKNNFKF